MITEIHETPRGIVMTRGKREIYLLARNEAQMISALQLANSVSFDRIYKGAQKAPIKNTRFVKFF